MSRLHRHQQSLASLEGEDYPRQAIRNRPRLIQASVAAPESSQVPLNYPLNVYAPFQWKYNVDEKSPWWRKAYFRFVWLPLARFSYFKMGIVPFHRLEPDGSLSWKEAQGVFLNEEDAQREASKYPYGGYDRVYFNAPEPARTVIGQTFFPGSEAQTEYEQTAIKEAKAETDKFNEVLKEAQTAIDRFRSRARHA